MRCPGQDTRYWKPGDIFESNCPECGRGVELFKDDSSRRCPHCGHEVLNPRLDPGCLEWCAYADKCREAFGKAAAAPEDTVGPLVTRLIEEVKAVFGEDERRIRHTLAVYRHAKALLKRERADPRVTLAAALLHDIGIREAEAKHGSSAGKYQELEGPPIARRILANAGVDAATVEHVCRIVGSHHSAGDIDTPEFRIVWDADWLVNMPEECGSMDSARLADFVDATFKTKAGKEKAHELFVKQEADSTGLKAEG